VAPNTYAYSGPLIQQWSENSNLAMLIRGINEEFNKQPPMPEQRGQPGQPQQQMGGQQPQYNHTGVDRYKGETVGMPKPGLGELRQRIRQM